jgi:hypothetical protein
MGVPANTKVKYRFYTSVVLLEMLKLRDACSGVAKAAMTRAVKDGTIILNAMQMFNFANEICYCFVTHVSTNWASCFMSSEMKTTSGVLLMEPVL